MARSVLVCVSDREVETLAAFHFACAAVLQPSDAVTFIHCKQEQYAIMARHMSVLTCGTS